MDSMHAPAPASPARFGAYLYTQFCSAFNDNVHFFAIALYLTYTVSATKEEAGRWQAIAGGAFVLPFILFSPLAGTLADRHDKRKVLIWAKWLEVLPMAVSFVSTFLPKPAFGLILGIFLMETRSAFFSPPKYGILPEIVAPDRLVRANGILQMLTMVAIVSGEAIAGTLLHRQGMQVTIGVCLALAVVGSLLAVWIPGGSPGDATRKLQLNPVAKIWGTIGQMKTDRTLFLTAFTLSCFWMVSAIFRSNVPLYGKLVLEINEEKASRLMAFVSVGIGIGAALASIIKNPEKSMGIVLPGVLGMSLSSIMVGLLGHTFLASGFMLAVLGLFGGLYLVPQTTIFQARSPAKRRGEYLAVQNFVNYLFMLFAALLFDLLTNRLHLSPREIFIGVGVGLAILGAAQAGFMKDLVLGPLKALFAGGSEQPPRGGGLLVRAFRFMLYIWMRIFHGLQFSGASNIPKEGPVIIAGNHPSYFDPVVLSLATTRHVRFFALADILKVPVVGWFARQWGILPVYRGGDNEPTVQKALRVLQRGGAIGIFPEGRRSLQYAMGTARPGVGRLAVQSGATIVPCVIYGTWKAWPHLTALPHPAKIVVNFLPPITFDLVDTRENHEKIALQVRELIVAEQLKHRVGPAPSDAYREAPDY